jgi:hypothetical protein
MIKLVLEIAGGILLARYAPEVVSGVGQGLASRKAAKKYLRETKILREIAEEKAAAERPKAAKRRIDWHSIGIGIAIGVVILALRMMS